MEKTKEVRTEGKTDAELFISKASEVCSLYKAGKITSHDALNILRRAAGKTQ